MSSSSTIVQNGGAFPPSSHTGGNYFPPQSTTVAHVDALAFSFKMENFTHADLPALCCTLSRFFPHISASARRGGWMGFSSSADINLGGLVAFGGDQQQSRVYVSLMGVACSLCCDWPGLALWLEQEGCRLSRVDLAYDDLEAKNYTVDAAISDYAAGAFNPANAGTPAKHKLISSGEWGKRPARTFYVGKRENGKMCRVYEKGQQLSDLVHPNWVRVEVELRAKDRVIPFDVLTQPAIYLAGAYPALGWISAIVAYIKTARIVAEKTLDQIATWAQRQVGRAVHALAIFHGGDYFAVVDRIKRAELPRRLIGAQSLLSPS